MDIETSEFQRLSDLPESNFESKTEEQKCLLTNRQKM